MFGALNLPKHEEELVAETTLEGYAVIKHLVDEKWVNGQNAPKVGDLVADGMIELSSGLVQLDFFCGASVVVQGPAKLELTSAWSAICHEGQLRAMVPPAARGFKIQTAQGEIEDLGTEFSVSVSDKKSEVHVIDGKVRLHSDAEPSQEMITGDRMRMTSAGYEESNVENKIANFEEIRLSAAGQSEFAYQRWVGQRQDLMKDERLKAYFPMDGTDWVGNQIIDRSPGHSEVSKKCRYVGFC